jgi:DNA-binding transcriptional ArsR family regulator
MTASLDGTLAALAEPTRRKVVDLLSERPRLAGELASALQMSPPAMSRHLRVLRLSGLIEEEHSGRADARLRVYRLRHQPFQQLRDWTAEVESFWNDQLAGFKSAAEGARKSKRP